MVLTEVTVQVSVEGSATHMEAVDTVIMADLVLRVAMEEVRQRK